MAKGKSSASSGTRKKPARRAAQVAGMDATENQQKKGKGDKKGGKKGKDKEPRKKVYIPPSKPAPVRPDPLDTLGIAQIVPAELLVVLRKLAKKDGVTKRRALEDLQADWVERARSADEEWRLSAVTDALPVWLHHFPSLLLHPSRRIRILTASLHTAILRLPSPTPERLFSFLSDVAEPEQVEYTIGTWLLSAYDVDRQVAGSAKDSWTRFTTISGSSSQATQEIGSRKLQLDEERLKQLWTLTYRTTLDPIGIYTYVNPPQPAVPPPQPHSARKGPARTPHGGGRNQGTQSQHRGGSAGIGREEDSGRTKSEEDEESEEDRSARLRVAGIGAAEWIFGACIQLVRNDDKKLEEFVRPLENPLLWSTLYHAQHAPFGHEDVQALGYGQPAVRRAAWSFLTFIVSNAATPITSLLPSLSSAVLRSAWVEPDVSVRNAMWGGVLGLLKAHPEAWTLATTIQVPSSGDDRNEEGEGSEDEDDSDDGSDEEPDRVPSKNSKSTEDTKDGAQLKEETMHTRTPSPAYQEFLQFLELGCMGTPTQAYPAVLVVLSTIPSSIIASTSTPLQTLFTSFWAAVDGRALGGLDRAAAGKAFLSAVLECAVYVSRRIVSSDEGGILLGVEETEMTEDDYQAKKEAAKKIVSEQVKRAWEEVSSGRLKVEERDVAELLARTLKTARAEEDITDSAWQTLSESIKSSLVSGSQAIPSLLASTLKIFAKSFELGIKLYEANKTLTEDITKEVLVQVKGILQEGDVEEGESRQAKARLNSFVGVIDTLGGEVFKDEEAVLKIDETVSANAYRLLILSPRLLEVYLAHRNDDARRTDLWRALLRATAQHPDELSTSLSALLDIVANTSDPVQSVLRPDVDELDGAVQHLLLEGGSHVLLKRLLRNPDPFISRQCFTGVLSTICNTFAQHVDDSLHGRSVASSASVDGLIGLLVVVTQENVFKALSKEDLMAVLADVFVFTYIVPLLEDGSNGKTGNEAAKTLWDNGVGRVSGEVQTVVIGLIKTKLRDLIVDCSVAIRPSALVNLFERGIPHLDENVFSDIVLAQADLDTLLSTLPGQPTSVSLAVTDPLVLPGEWDESDSSGIEFDKYGLSPYARLVNTLLLHFLRHRDLARQNIWALRHLYALKIYAQDVLDVPFAPSPVFGRTTDRMELGDVVQKISQIAAYLLSEDHEQGWLAQLALRLTQNKTNSESHAIEKLLKILISPAQGPDAHRDARILRLVLQHLFASAEKTDAEAWLVLARGVEKSAPYAALAITYSVTQYAPEPPRLDRLRNELAANALGIPASKANTEGLWTLRRLAAVAPDPESDIVYLPTPRAVNLMKACQQWITSDEDLDEAVDSEMTSVFLHLAPILQNMPGSHWDLVFDVIENNLENCSFDEHSTLPLLSRTLQLIIAVEDLASTNRSLRSGWDERRSAILTIVRDLTAKKPEETAMSTPLSVCREHALTIVQDLPQKLIGNDTLSKMCHLVTDASESVPQMAYKMLREAAYKRTEFLVVEASVDTDETLPLNLPEELVQLLQQSFLDEDIDEGVHNHHVFGYLLTWMLVFDLFTNASLKVKSGYMDHLRRENLVEDRFLPQVFTILRIYGGPSKAFKLDIWEVDEFYLEMYSTEIPLGLQLLAAHLYYRALLLVPSLIRNWLLDCRDRQLSATVTNYTSAYFSPFIVRAELAQVKDPSLAADLADENFTVKVANAINEITAAFAVDEYSLELKLRLPTDFPLHPITTKDSNRIGVTEERWRSWVLGVQQILTFRSGNIVDGLAFFKKNVTSHFEGQSECAICYSMISAMDGSLPTKPCKTCKNRFHAGCLYKWFNTSHSSSCPLCRSEIIQ